MSNSDPHGVRKRLRQIFWCIAIPAAIFGMVWLYQNYLTPKKLIVRTRLNEADTNSEKAIDARLKPLADLFVKGRKGAKAFAERAVSWRGKWELMKGLTNHGESHRSFLSDEYERLVFSSDELRDAIEASVKGYMNDIEVYESEMLVKLRADLANSERTDDSLPAHLRGDEVFQQEYRKVAEQIMKELKAGICVTIGREVVLFVAASEATTIAMQAARAAGTSLGISGGLLGAGASSTVATLGVGLVVFVIIDYILNEILKEIGLDPSANIEKLIIESINKLEEALLRDPGTFSWNRKKGTLRQKMEELHEARSILRREAIARLMNEGGMK